ncbi:MAG: sensor domain-containing diguanylate cyclase [Rhodocyclaceae bacterium]|nr:sensor domain-containing diguanylate cyclase [Rhodocyclaceae bacterium]
MSRNDRIDWQSAAIGDIVFVHSHEGIIVTDAEQRIVSVNPGFVRVTGYTADEAVGRRPGFLSAGRHDREFYERMWQALHSTGSWQGEIRNRKKSGEEYEELLTISTVRDGLGRITHYVGIFTDISEIKAQQRALEHMAYHDPLTGLPNRTLLADRLSFLLPHCRRGRKMLAVCYLDLDGFKQINDGYGHAAGDRVLVEVAGRLVQCARENDTVARLGGDEFVLLLGDFERAGQIRRALDRILRRLAVPWRDEAHAFDLSASIGVALYPADGSEPDTLLRRADQAMYAAKQNGRNSYRFFAAG